MPWVQEASRRKYSLAIADCSECMRTQSKQIRQHMACGYLPPIEGARPWSPASMKSDWTFAKDEPDLTTCPGYTTNLPEAIEIARARVHWSKGNGCDERLALGVEVLEGASNECQAWAMENAEARK